MKNEPLIEIANKFINNCNNFEIRNLEPIKSHIDNSNEIINCSNYINRKSKCNEEKYEGNLIKTGNDSLDRLCLFEKGMFNLFYTDDNNGNIFRLINSSILQAVKNGIRVLSISGLNDILINEFQKSIKNNYGNSGTDWFSGKYSYICECMPKEDLKQFIKTIKSKIIALKTDILYIPCIEEFFINYKSEFQIDTLKYLYDFAFDNGICVVSTLSSFTYLRNYDFLFNDQVTPNEDALKHHLPAESLYKVDFNKDIAKFECKNIWDEFTNSEPTAIIKSLNDFYNFDLIKII